MSRLRVAIVGCGLIGAKRAEALGAGDELVACHDLNAAAAGRLCELHGGEACASVEELLGLAPDVVIVATTHDRLSEFSERALGAGAHVLVEKPAGVSLAQVEHLIECRQASGRLVKVGFNHRFHPGIARAVHEVRSGRHGELMHVRARYGHGGRLGYEREWRADPAVSGGGELLDQGVHLIDLSRWFLGDFTEVRGHVATYFWQMPVEDNGFLWLENVHRQVAWLHASCTEWKNLFSFEVFGRDGKLQVDGLGGSYGTERLSFYRMLPPRPSICSLPSRPKISKQNRFFHSVQLACSQATRPCSVSPPMS